MSRTIPLTRGYVAIVDDEDYQWLRQWRWGVWAYERRAYAVRNLYLGNQRQSRVRMHREILQAPEGMLVDHIDGNGLNNRRSNLRLATHKENARNSRKSIGVSSSTYKGVAYEKETGQWRARIRDDNGLVYIDRYHSEEAAACAYDLAAVRCHGEFARLNFPGRSQQDKERLAREASAKEQLALTRSSKHQGVHFHKGIGKWVARVTIGGRRKNIGSFLTEEEAITAREAHLRSAVADEEVWPSGEEVG